MNIKTEVDDLSNLKAMAPDIEKLSKAVDHQLVKKRNHDFDQKNKDNEVKKLSESINYHNTERSNTFVKIKNDAKLLLKETDFWSSVVSLNSNFKKSKIPSSSNFLKNVTMTLRFLKFKIKL